MNINHFNLKDTLKEYDSDFLLELSKAFNPNYDNFATKHNLQYAGELAERFLERDIIKTPKQLICLIDVFCNIFSEENFQLNQKKSFIENVFKWLEKNETTEYEKFLIKVSIISYIFYHFDSLFETSKQTLESLITDIEKYTNGNRILIPTLILFCRYRNFSSTNSSNDKNEWLIKLKNAIIALLNSNGIDLSEYDIEEIKSITTYLLEDKKNNIIKEFDLKVKDFKSNKNNLNILKAMRRLIHSEMTKEKIEKDKVILGLSEIEILYLNIDLSKYKISYAISQKLSSSLLENIFKENKLVDKKILQTSICSNESYTIARKIEKFYNKETNKELMRFYINSFKPSTYSCGFLKNFLLEKENLFLMNDNRLEESLYILLNNVFKTKEDFDYFYKVYKEKEFKNITLGDNFQFNLFKFKYIDIFDKTTIEKNDMKSSALNYVKYEYGDIARYLYISNISYDNFYTSLGIDRLQYLLNDTNNFKELSLVFNLTDDENLSDEKYKSLVSKSAIYNTLTYFCLKNIEEFIYSLFTILQDRDLYKYLDLNFDELIDIKKTLLESGLLSKEQEKTLKELFQEKTFADKKNEENFLTEIDNSCSDFVLKNYAEFFETCRSNFEILNDSKTIQDKILYILDKSFKAYDLSSSNFKDMWLNYSLFYFFTKNNGTNKDFENNLLEIINSFYLLLNE